MADTVTSSDGKVLTLRKLKAIDQVRLLRAIGAEQSRNEPYVRIVEAAAAVELIDGVPNPIPRNEMQIDAMIQRVGDEGLNAIIAKQMADMKAMYDALMASQAAAETGDKDSGPLAQSAA